MRRKDHPGPGKEEPGPEKTKILRAMDFYREALKHAPRNPRDVRAEGKKAGHSEKTQERARGRLHVQVIPPTTKQGPWLIALPDDPAVEAAKRRKEEKDWKRRERQGNGRKRRQKIGGGSKPRAEVPAPGQ